MPLARQRRATVVWLRAAILLNESPFLTVTEREDVPDECLVREGVEAWARLALRMALYVRAYSALAAGEKLRAF